jgi:hypothetical protein
MGIIIHQWIVQMHIIGNIKSDVINVDLFMKMMKTIVKKENK